MTCKRRDIQLEQAGCLGISFSSCLPLGFGACAAAPLNLQRPGSAAGLCPGALRLGRLSGIGVRAWLPPPVRGC